MFQSTNTPPRKITQDNLIGAYEDEEMRISMGSPPRGHSDGGGISFHDSPSLKGGQISDLVDYYNTPPRRLLGYRVYKILFEYNFHFYFFSYNPNYQYHVYWQTLVTIDVSYDASDMAIIPPNVKTESRVNPNGSQYTSPGYSGYIHW
jgi:hypothetical protein